VASAVGVTTRRHRLQEHVRWSDVDVSGLVRWDAYTRYVELAETELFRAAGYPYATLWESLDIWLPRVQFHLELRKPARLDEVLEVESWVGRIGRSSIQLEFAIGKSGEAVAEARLTIVAIGRDSRKPVAVPAALAAALAPYRADGA
jgi:YbgC/YbaW family acyl-CoA thioester hydrolase